MTAILDIDAQAVKTLEGVFGPDLSRIALEALAAEGYRLGKLSQYQVQTLLGFSDRWAAQAWLKEHGVSSPLSLEEVVGDSLSSKHARETV